MLGAAMQTTPTTLFTRPTLAERIWLLRVLRRETVGGLLMLGAAVIALLWANTRWASSYRTITGVELGPEALHLHMPLSVWAADFLLAFFFYLAGLELKHEVRHGSLARPAQAAVPVVAALCGMVVPALIFVAFTWPHPEQRIGWGIPMATDIAFALAVLAIMGQGLPLALRAFLLTLAVVDDLGAITVIAVFYSDSFHALALAGALLCVLVWFLLQRRPRSGLWVAPVYCALFLLTWYLTHESGVHATVAGVALGLATRVTAEPGERLAPAEVAEIRLRPFVAGLAVPLFAFTSAGVTIRDVPGAPVSVPPLADTLTSPLTLGVLLGLLVGKPVGVVGGAWLMARFTRASLNPSLRWADMGALGLLAGIGFTVSLLIAELAYDDRPLLLGSAKVGVLGATLLAAVLSSVGLARRRRALAALVAEEERDDDHDGIPDVYQQPEPPRDTGA